LALLPIIEAQLRTVAGVLNKKECRIMIEFLMSKNVTYLELFYIFLGVVLSKVYLALRSRKHNKIDA
jgi:hypothetical protein